MPRGVIDRLEVAAGIADYWENGRAGPLGLLAVSDGGRWGCGVGRRERIAAVTFSKCEDRREREKYLEM